MAPTMPIVAEVLREDNYEDWSDVVRDYLMSHDLWWGIIDGSREVADFERLEKKNAAALHAIKTSCSPHIMSDLKKKNKQNSDLKIAKNLWNALKDKVVKVHPGADHALFHQFVPLQKAINKGDLDGVKKFLSHNPDARNAKISSTGMTATHLATLAGHVEIVKELIKGMSEELEKENNDGDTALCMAAYNGKTKIAQLLVEKHFALIGFPTPSELIPVSIACMRGHKEATHFLYSVTAEHFKDFGKNNIILLNDAVFNNMFDIALDIVKNEPHGLGTKSCERCHSALVTLSSMPAAFSSSTRFSFWQRLIYQCQYLSLP
ncbi:hypothetical protein HS088_TW21G01587 [Tripterygium wilfordii]|uniref:DUF4219 domain-containing protein n=1 Tax=Tripterygium wilfordii TaxID=458696 RepID=A0A7J7C5P5_TRIWF|nr:hypothetical protein HS088_TW21G01587 [Tripterygium wilfordii]